MIYVQHYTVIPNPIDSYLLKNTKRNLESKSAAKYATTTDTSTIIKCPGCQNHNTSYLNEAFLRANQNFRSPPMCLFKQNIDVAQVLPIKSHQLYKDIILLKQHLMDLLPQYDPNTNKFPPQDHVNSRLQTA